MHFINCPPKEDPPPAEKLEIEDSHRGFSLLELLIVIGLMGILAGVTMLNLSGFNRQSELDAGVQEIGALLRDAEGRATAQSGGDGWGVRFTNNAASPDSHELWSGSSYAAGNVVKHVLFPSSLELVDPSSGNTKDVIFAKRTGLPSASTTVILSLRVRTAASSTITVNVNGLIAY